MKILKAQNFIETIDTNRLFKIKVDKETNESKLIKTRYYKKFYKAFLRCGGYIHSDQVLEFNKNVYSKYGINLDYIVEDIFKICWSHELLENLNYFNDEILKRIQKRIIDSKLPKLMVGFARKSRLVDIENIERFLFGSNDIYVIYEYLTVVKKLSFEDTIKEIVEKCGVVGLCNKLIPLEIFNRQQLRYIEQVVVDSNDLEKIYLYCKENKDCSSLGFFELQRTITRSDNPHYVYNFALNVEKANKEILQRAIIRIKNTHFIKLFAATIEGADVEQLQDAYIKNTTNLRDLIDFAKMVKGANIAQLEDIIVNSNDMSLIYTFLHEIEGVNFDRLYKTILNGDNPQYIFMLAKEIAGVDLDECERKIKLLRSTEYSRKITRLRNTLAKETI